MSMPVTRYINGQEYQAATTEVRVLFDTGADFILQTWTDLKYEDGAEKKGTNRADGKLDGYTLDVQKTSGSLKVRLSEFYLLQDQFTQIYPDIGILQVEFSIAIVYGNSISKLRSDRVRALFQKIPKEAGSNQEALMVDLSLFVLDVQSSSRRAVAYGSP